MEDFVRDFLNAVYPAVDEAEAAEIGAPGYAELVAATFNEKVVLKCATELLTDYWELKKAHKELLDRCVAYGTWGPWADGWEGSYDQKHWGEE